MNSTLDAVHVHDPYRSVNNPVFVGNVGFLDGHVAMTEIGSQLNTDRYEVDPFVSP